MKITDFLLAFYELNCLFFSLFLFLLNYNPFYRDQLFYNLNENSTQLHWKNLVEPLFIHGSMKISFFLLKNFPQNVPWMRKLRHLVSMMRRSLNRHSYIRRVETEFNRMVQSNKHKKGFLDKRIAFIVLNAALC